MSALTNLPVPLALQYRDRHGIKTFVETGTAGGHTAELAANLFEQVYSVEVDKERMVTASRRLAGYHNITLRLGDSVSFLESMRQQLHGNPVLYFLDSHWCGGERFGPECPLLRELQAIGKMFNERQVVMIDDARLFINPPPPPHRPEEWPTMDEIVSAVNAWCKPWRYFLDGDIIIIEGRPEP